MDALYGSALKSCRCQILYITGILGFVLEHLGLPVESLYIDAHKPNLSARCAKLSVQCVSKIKSLYKHSTPNAVFDNQ